MVTFESLLPTHRNEPQPPVNPPQPPPRQRQQQQDLAPSLRLPPSAAPPPPLRPAPSSCPSSTPACWTSAACTTTSRSLLRCGGSACGWCTLRGARRRRWWCGRCGTTRCCRCGAAAAWMSTHGYPNIFAKCVTVCCEQIFFDVWMFGCIVHIL